MDREEKELDCCSVDFLKFTAVYQVILEHFMCRSADKLYGDADLIILVPSYTEDERCQTQQYRSAERCDQSNMDFHHNLRDSQADCLHAMLH